ncbi:NADH-quinone oxidoreductase subunit NuoH [Raineyella sp. W15-4]|uniref:NADH-quinone oxidoreductase subunit NuoH n=1 Tax=Raineyella sp. W15-4 TaxID=3081651 RepID=UPI0029554119|nr:NADH-quinone oxidoreductase subunit NuoH [Raineyella sp. W15-4]WOQ17686.1 NADH-quinone oxidoreductase subunit NuoH [Raineyella sp. W15-4]
MIPLDLSLFGHDPVWLVIVKVIIWFVFILLATIFNVWMERRTLGRMQQRIGPNFAGPFGLIQALGDGLKLLFKEDVTPKLADRFVFKLAPFIMTVVAFGTFSLIPFGGTVKMFGVQTQLQLVDTPAAVLLYLALTSIAVYGVVLAGWSSSSTYALLGGLRSTASMISYEIAMGLSLVSVFLYAGTMSTSEIVQAQARPLQFGSAVWQGSMGWYFLLLIPSFIIYVISMFAETNRQPFDLPEAEGELGSGYMTEYSGMTYALFFLSEYINMFLVSCVATTLFMGGYLPIWPFNNIPALNNPWLGPVWFLIKAYCFMFLFMWVRATVPRIRYDQLMRLGWKWLIPISLGWTMLVAVFRVGVADGWIGSRGFWIAAIVVAAVLIALLLFGGPRQAAEPEPEPTAFDPYAGGYPVPPMGDQQVPGLVDVVSSAVDEPAGAALSETSDSQRRADS